MTQTTNVPENESAGALPPLEVMALVIAWSAEEPDRVGEVALVASEGPFVLGRGEGEAEEETRLRFFRQRPGVFEPRPTLASRGISRRQLLLAPSVDGLAIRRIGQCALEVNGVRRDQATVGPGDVIALRRELLLHCVQRTALMPRSRLFSPADAPRFGEADTLGLIGESPAAWALRERIAFAAKADTHVLVLGASGTGKELVARAIHRLSSRAARPFLARNAATLPSGLVDAELFGNARNYPNAGMAERPGLIGEVDGGTLFLDEIGELPSELQAHLLRVLDADGEYQRLGEATTRRSSFRLVAATNRDPSALKHDFAARLTATVEVPELCERREDIPLLAAELLRRAAKRSPELAGRFVSARAVQLAPSLVAHLLERTYTTNVRELDAVLWKGLAESGEDAVELPKSLRAPLPAPRPEPAPPPASRPEPGGDEIRSALAAAGGNVTQAARTLGVSSRFALYRLMKKHGIDVT